MERELDRLDGVGVLQVIENQSKFMHACLAKLEKAHLMFKKDS